MLLSFYTHVLFLISAVIFSCSFISFIKRVQILDEILPWSLLFPNFAEREFTLTSTDLSSSNVVQERFDELRIRNRIDNRHSNHLVNTSRKIFSILDRFTFSNPTDPICNYSNNTEQYLIFVVLSRSSNFDHRQAIRATWGRNGKFKRSNIYIQTIFFVGTNDGHQVPIRMEQDMFNDVVEIGIPEQYPFVAHKELASIYWTRLYCPMARFVFRADDDILLDIFSLLNYIEYRVERPVKPGIFGWFRFNNTVHRADKWSVTKQEYSPSFYPPYTFGIGYLFSNETAAALIQGANHSDHQVIRIGDAYITGILREAAHLPYYDFNDLEYAYTFYQQLECDNLFEQNPKLLICMSKAHIGVMNDPHEFFDVWDTILSRYNITLNSL